MVKVATQQQQRHPSSSLLDNHHDDDIKSRLAVEISSISQRANFASCYCCSHRHHSHRHNHHRRHNCIRPPHGDSTTSRKTHHNKPQFIDWYIVLKVEEDANVDSIRKQYHKLALLLHPDKNQHPKAEIAFKLLQQAYSCLSDESKRQAFHCERQRNMRMMNSSCECRSERIINSNLESSRRSSSAVASHMNIVHEIKQRMEEETKVIEHCININRQPHSKKHDDYPVFSPSRYLHQGYPHRGQSGNTSKHCQQRRGGGGGESFLELMMMARDQGGGLLNLDRRRASCETPVFEIRSDGLNTKFSTACLSSYLD